MEMDPTVVMKLVREQKRQISDSYGASPNSHANSIKSAANSNANSNSHTFQLPPPPPPPPGHYHHQQQQSIRNRSSLHQPQPTYHNSSMLNNNNTSGLKSASSSMSNLNDNKIYYINYNNNNGASKDEHEYVESSKSSMGNHKPTSHANVYSSSTNVKANMSNGGGNEYEYYNNNNNNNNYTNGKNQYYYQQQQQQQHQHQHPHQHQHQHQLQSNVLNSQSTTRQTPPNIIVDATISRSGSVKSVASDSGVGSSSPLSDCSDYGHSNGQNANASQTNSNGASAKSLNKQSQMSEIILVGAHHNSKTGGGGGFKPPLNSATSSVAKPTSLSPNVNNKSLKNPQENAHLSQMPSVSPVAAALTATTINNSLPGKKRKNTYDDPSVVVNREVVFVDAYVDKQGHSDDKTPQGHQPVYANAKQNAQQQQQQQQQNQQLNHFYNQAAAAAAAAAAHHQQFYHNNTNMNNHNYAFAHQMNSHEAAQSSKAQLSKQQPPCNMACCVPIKQHNHQQQQQHQQQQFLQPGLVNYNGKSNHHLDINNNNMNMNDQAKAPSRPRTCTCKDCCGEVKFLDKKGETIKAHQQSHATPPPHHAGSSSAFNLVQPTASCCDCPGCNTTLKAAAASNKSHSSLTPPSSSVPKIQQNTMPVPVPSSPASLSVNTQQTPNRFIISPNSSFSPMNANNNNNTNGSYNNTNLKTTNDNNHLPYPPVGHHYQSASPRYSDALIDYRNVKQAHEQKQMMYDGMSKGSLGPPHGPGPLPPPSSMPSLPPPPPLPMPQQHMMPNVNFCNCADCLKANRIDSDLSKAAAVAAAAVIAAQHQHHQQQMHHNKSINLAPKPIKPLHTLPPMNGMYMNDAQQQLMLSKSKSASTMKLNKTSSPLPLEAALSQTNLAASNLPSTAPTCLASMTNEYNDLLVNGHHIIKQKNNILINGPNNNFGSSSPSYPPQTSQQDQLMKLKRKHSYGDLVQDVAAIAKMNMNKPIPIAPNPAHSPHSHQQQQQHHAYQSESYLNANATAARPPSKKYKTSSIDKPLTPFIVAAPLVNGNQSKPTSNSTGGYVHDVGNGENQSANVNGDDKPTSLVCLAVNKPKLNENESANDDEEEIELGEVVSIEKLKNTSAELINFDGCPTTFANFSKTEKQTDRSMPVAASDAPVTISKKVLPIVTRCVSEWLEKSVELVYKISTKSDDVELDSLFCVLHKAWPRVLLIYMIENSFDYCITKDSLTTESSSSPSANDEEKKDDNDDSDSKNSKLPREKDALQFNDIITKGHGFNLNSHEYDLLRELIIYREGSEDSTFNRPYLKAQLNFQETIESSHGKQHFSKLLHFMPNIYNTNVDIIESLFCRSLNNFKSVQDLFNKKLQNLLVDEEEKQTLNVNQPKSPTPLVDSNTENVAEKNTNNNITTNISSPNIQISSDEQSHISSPQSQHAVSTPASTPTPSASPATTVKNNSESVSTRENNN